MLICQDCGKKNLATLYCKKCGNDLYAKNRRIEIATGPRLSIFDRPLILK